jgi:HK97 family phage portal protein
LWPLEPHFVKPEIDASGKKVFRYKVKEGDEPTYYRDDEILHFPGFCYDGLKGYGIMDFAKEAIGLGLAIEDFGARFFRGDGIPLLFITHPEKLKKETRVQIKEAYREQSQGVEMASNSQGGRGAVVLDEGMKPEKIGITADEAQMLTAREFTTDDVCRWLRIPPFMLARISAGTGTTAEDQYNFFVTFSLQPWMVPICEQIATKLLTGNDRYEYEVVFDTGKLVAMTAASRFQNYSSGRNMGLFTLNNIARKEGEPLIKGEEGEQRISPSTMKILGAKDPSVPIETKVLDNFISLISKNRNLEPDVALRIGLMLMPTADPKVIKDLITNINGGKINDTATGSVRDQGGNPGQATGSGGSR